MLIRKFPLLLILSWLIANSVLAQNDDLQKNFYAAQFNFDLVLALELLPEFEQAARVEDTEDAWLRYVSAALLVAELKRGEYEYKALEKKEKRKVGRDIDEVAKAALGSLETLPESSERYRLEADLLGTMIRSKFKGMKYQPRLEKAIDKALQLDENNANAWVSYGRRPLFAPAKHGGDPGLALEYMNRALKINPQHVQALLFRGLAHSKLGNTEEANTDWTLATQLNPNTAKARDRLLSLEIPFEETEAAVSNKSDTASETNPED